MTKAKGRAQLVERVARLVNSVEEFVSELESELSLEDDFIPMVHLDKITSFTEALKNFGRSLGEGGDFAELAQNVMSVYKETKAEILRSDTRLGYGLESIVHPFITDLEGLVSTIREIPAVQEDIDRAIVEAENQGGFYDEDELEPSLDETVFALEGIADSLSLFINSLNLELLSTAKDSFENDVNIDLTTSSQHRISQWFDQVSARFRL